MRLRGGPYGRRQLGSKDAASRFKRELAELYGPAVEALPFFEGPYARAYDVARTELKFLLVVLVAPEHDDTESFVRDTLLSPDVVAMLADSANDIVLWGGNMRDSEAYQVFLEFGCTKFPWSAVVCLTPEGLASSGSGSSSTRMGAARRLVGPMSGADYAAAVLGTIARRAPELQAVRAERVANEAARSLRTEQDSAYERSLAIDRERARKKREAERRARDDEEAAALLEQNRLQWRRWRAATLPPSLVVGASAADAAPVRLAIKLPGRMGGASIRRAFPGDATLEELYALVECHDLLQQQQQEKDIHGAEGPPDSYTHEYRFRIASLMPREVYPPSKSATLRNAIGRSGNVIVEELDQPGDDGADGNTHGADE